MITIHSTLIREPRGHVRVLRLASVGHHLYPLTYLVSPDEEMCHSCGCTNLFGCVGGCGWVDLAHTICSRCFERSMLP